MAHLIAVQHHITGSVFLVNDASVQRVTVSADGVATLHLAGGAALPIRGTAHGFQARHGLQNEPTSAGDTRHR